MTKISNQTYSFAKILVKIKSASTELSVLKKDSMVALNAKHELNRWIISLDSIIRNFKNMIPDDAAKKIFEEQLLNDEDTGQVNAIIDFVLACPKGIRDEIEQYAESRYDIYSSNQKIKKLCQNQ